MVELPPILAGPIVRRVEPTTASFWIATSKPASVRAEVYDLGGNKVGTGIAPTRPFGDNLHVVVVTIAFAGPLAPLQVYSYDIFVGDKGLQQLGLLADKPPTDTFPGQLALGYTAGRLPSFVTPADSVTGLRLAHASCRKTNGPHFDAMAWLDDHIKANLDNPSRNRTQQLFLTGDQIYADEVAPCLLPMLTELGRDLLGAGKTEYVPFGEGALATSCGCTTRELPAMRRQLLLRTKAGFTSTGAHNHLIGFGEYAAMYLAVWSPHVWRAMATLDQLYQPIDASSEAAAHLTPWETVHDYIKKGGWRPATEEETAEENHRADVFRSTVPKVARALANVATYMQWDDHEITDDWNLNKSWWNRVYSTSLGFAVVRNGVMAHTIFQMWGNDPAAFAAPGNNRDLLDAAATVANGAQPGLADITVDDRLRTLIGAGSGTPDQRARFHFTVASQTHVVAVTDSRTHRKFTGETVRPPSLLGDSMASQIPASLLVGTPLLIVVSPAPVLSPTLFDTIAQPIVQGVRDAINFERKQKFAESALPGGPVWGWEDYDGEGWGANEEALEQMLLHLAKHGKVVILSGDVHYSNTLALDLWQKDLEATPSRIVQLTCSSARNDMKPVLHALVRHNAHLQEYQAGLAAERLAWHAGGFKLKYPADEKGVVPKVALGRQARAQRSPALLPARGWPAGTTADRVFDWRWRMTMIRDIRPNAQIPAAYQQPTLAKDVPLTPNMFASYAAVVPRHVDFTKLHLDHVRQMVFGTNIGLVSFTGSGPTLKVVHTILAQNGANNEAVDAAVHAVPLVTPPGEPLPNFPPAKKPAKP